MDYHDYNDYELLMFIGEKNEHATDVMFKKYQPFIYSIATKMLKHCHNTSLELNDLVQEGMIGLNTAIVSYNEKKEIVFYTYAKKCIEGKMISLIIASKRQKHRLLNESISLSGPTNEDDLELEDRIGDNSYNPEYKLFEHESEEELIANFRLLLTDFEDKVFMLKISGFDYKEISEILERSNKAIDNSLQRIKIKLRKYLKA